MKNPILFCIFICVCLIECNSLFAQRGSPPIGPQNGIWIESSQNPWYAGGFGGFIQFYGIFAVSTQTAWVVGRNTGYPGDPGFMCVTTDGGNFWLPVPDRHPLWQTAPSGSYLRGVYFIGPNGWMCGTNGIIIFTSDGGNTWVQQGAGITTQQLNKIAFADSKKGLVIGNAGTMFRTTNGGFTWIPVNPGVSVDLLCLSVVGSTMYVGGRSRLTAGGIEGTFIKSTDYGATWFFPGIAPFTAFDIVGTQFLDGANGYALSDSTLFVTNDGGQFWNSFTTGASVFYNTLRFTDLFNGWLFPTADNIQYTKSGGGGKPWFTQRPPTSTGVIYDAHFAGPKIGYACGDGFIIKYDGRYPYLFRSATSVNLGTILCTNIKLDTVYISNQGDADLNISNVFWDGANAPEFTLISPTNITQTNPVNIPANGTVVPFIVQFKAVGWGDKFGIMIIESNDSINYPAKIHYRAHKDSSGLKITNTNIRFNPACVGTSFEQFIPMIASGNINPTITSITQISGDTVFKILSPIPPFTVSFLNPVPIRMKFTPDALGNFSAVYRIIVQPCDREIILNVTGLGATTDLTLLPTVGVDFGKVEVADSMIVKVRVNNIGNTAAHVIDFKVRPPVRGLTIPDQPALPWSFGPGGYQELRLKFLPDTIVDFNSTLCVVWDQPCPDSVCIPLKGRGVMEPLIIHPGVVKFGSIMCSNDTIKTVFIRNNGHAPLNIMSARIEGPDAKNFSLISPSIPTIINPLDSIPVVLGFSSTSPGAKAAALVLVHDDSVRNPSRIALGGWKDEIKITIDGDTVAFRRVCVKDSIILRYDIRNSGTVQMKITSITDVSGNSNFKLKSLTLPLIIDVNQSKEFYVIFKPSSQGVQTTRLQIVADPCGAQTLLSITELGVQSVIKATPLPLQFGDVKVGGSATKYVIINNSGTSAQFTKIFFTPPISGVSISPAPSLPQQWLFGRIDSLPVVIAPTVAGNISTTLNLVFQSECPETVRVPILARATSTSITVNRNTLLYSFSPCDQRSICDTVRISNTGTSDLQIQSIDVPLNIFSISSAPTTPFNLGSGQSILLQVCANGNFVGNISTDLVIQSDDPQRPIVNVGLNANRDSANIRVASSSLDFGFATKCDTNRSISIAVTNTGSVVDSVSALIPNGTPFTVTSAASLRLNPGETKNFTILFAPKSIATFSSTLSVRSSLCNTTSSVQLRGAREVLSFTSSPSPFDFGDVTVATSANRDLTLRAAHSNKSRIVKIIFRPAAPQFTSSTSLPVNIDSMGTTTIPITFIPSDTGTFRSDVCFVFDQPCNDTICVSIAGRGVRGVLRNSDNQLVYGEAAQCQIKRDTLTITNVGNQPVNLLSSAIIGSTYFTVVNPITTTEILPAGQNREFYVVFNPSTAPDGNYNATLRIISNDAQRPTIDVQLTGTRTTQSLPLVPLTNFGLVILGQQPTNQIIITNNGTAEFCINAIVGGVRFASNISLPQCIKPGQQLQLPVTFFPIDTFIVNETLRLIVDKTCSDSIRVPLAGRGAQGVVAQTLQIQFGTVASCKDVIDTVKITNRGNGTITYQSASITGANANQFTIVSQPVSPKDILPGQTEFILVRFTPTGFPDGAKSASVNTTILVNSQPQQFVTQLNGTATTITFNYTGTAFNQTIVGASVQQNIIVTNTSSLPVTILPAAISDPAFAILNSVPSLPAIIPPGGSITLNVQFQPSSVKVYSVTLNLPSSLPCTTSYQRTITGEGIVQNVVAATLSIGTIRGKPLDRILIPITLQNDVGGADVVSYTGTMQFNRSMLYPYRVVKENSLSSAMTVNMSYDHKLGEVTINASGTKVNSGTGALVFLDCEVLIGDSAETPLRIGAQFDFTSGRATVVQRVDGLFQLEGYCLCDGRRLMKVDGQFRLWQNYPNPFNPTTSIRYQLAEDGFTVLLVKDALGREVRRLVDGFQKEGLHQIEFDGNNFPTGFYYYTLSSGRFTDTKKMILKK